MRVTTQSVDEFLESLTVAKDIFDSTIRVSITRRAARPGPDNVIFVVIIQISAVVVAEGGGEYLLDCGEECGRDIEDSTQDFGGSVRAKQQKQKIVDYATLREWRVLPGVVSD